MSRHNTSLSSTNRTAFMASPLASGRDGSNGRNFGECQRATGFQVDIDAIAGGYLVGSNKVRERINDMALRDADAEFSTSVRMVLRS